MKTCIISLTYNRPKYIERSFESLYKRAGVEFDHYVFDDCSNEKTQKKLLELQKKYKFKIIVNTERQNIAKNFCKAIVNIPREYSYYVKFDSDVEILTDDLFSEMQEAFNLKNKTVRKVSGASPRIEGVYTFQRHPDDIEFYNGHTLRLKTSVAYGCCMMFIPEVFRSFQEYAKNVVKDDSFNEKWGIDTRLYDEMLIYGAHLTIEDLSVYHIDNFYGQRKDFEYFTKRKRWNIIDYEHAWFLRASKVFENRFISLDQMHKLRTISKTFNEFLNNIKKYFKGELFIAKIAEDIEAEKIAELNVKKQNVVRKIYRITSPKNFAPDKHIEHGSFKYFEMIPDWARNNPKVLVESISAPSEEIDKNL